MAQRHNKTVAMTGSEVAYTIPADTSEISLQAVGGTVTLAFTSGGDTRTLADGDVFEIEDPNAGRQTLYLTGAVGVTAEIMYATGLSA